MILPSRLELEILTVLRYEGAQTEPEIAAAYKGAYGRRLLRGSSYTTLSRITKLRWASKVWKGKSVSYVLTKTGTKVRDGLLRGMRLAVGDSEPEQRKKAE